MGVEALVPLLVPYVLAVVLAMARTGGLLLGLPHTSARGVPATIVAITTLSISIALVGLDPGGATAAPTDLVRFGVQLVSEFAFGLGLGFIVQMALAVAQSAGEIIGVEMGLSFAAIADPMSANQSTAPAAMLSHVAMQLMLALGLDRLAIRGLARSLQVRPLGTASLDSALIELVLSLLDRLVLAAFSLALPLMGAILCLKVGMAMLARIAPKLQIFNLSFVLTIGVGLFFLQLSWPGLVATLGEELRDWTEIALRFAVRPPTGS